MTEPVTPTLPELAAVAATLRRSLESSPSAEAFTVPATDARILLALLDGIHAATTTEPIALNRVATADASLDAIAAEIAEQACREGGGDAADDGWVRDRLDLAVATAPTRPYVHRLLDALLRQADYLDFQGAIVPADVRFRLEDAAKSGAIRPIRDV